MGTSKPAPPLRPGDHAPSPGFTGVPILSRWSHARPPAASGPNGATYRPLQAAKAQGLINGPARQRAALHYKEPSND
jgi:hypothetical protein